MSRTTRVRCPNKNYQYGNYPLDGSLPIWQSLLNEHRPSPARPDRGEQQQMSKLTNYQRDRIASVAVTHSFTSREEAMKVAEDALAREAYNSLFPQNEQRLVAKLPEKWVRRDACLKFNVYGQRITLHLIGDGLPVPQTARGYCEVLGAIPAGDLCDRIQGHAQAIEKMKEDRSAAGRAVKALLQSVTTFGKLREVWPEGAPFLADIDKTPASLPAVRVDEVNAILGLSEASA